MDIVYFFIISTQMNGKENKKSQIIKYAIDFSFECDKIINEKKGAQMSDCL